jgi:ubiquinone/menaquinone biosynthesis C-methylase UbiE
MNNRTAYNKWSKIYDTNENRTRDLEAMAIREMLFFLANNQKTLELGCGTGKNTDFLLKKSEKMVAIDFSENMLALAKLKFAANENIEFLQLDLREKWPIAGEQFSLVTVSLVLEHIRNLNHFFSETARVLKSDGYFIWANFTLSGSFWAKKPDLKAKMK